MFRRAWKRTLAFALEHPGRLVGTNAGFFLLLLVPAIFLTGSRVFHWAEPWLALPLAWAWSWMALAWLVEAMRRRFEGRQGWMSWTGDWLKESGPRHLGNGLVLAAGMAWVAFNAAFWLSLGERSPLVSVALVAATVSFGLWLGLAGMVSLGLASGPGPGGLRRAKIYALAPLAWFPSCLAAALSLALLSGVFALLAGVDHWAVRLAAVPLFFLPVFTSAMAGGILAAMDGEIRAAAMDRPSVDSKLPGLRELFRPWDP